MEVGEIEEMPVDFYADSMMNDAFFNSPWLYRLSIGYFTRFYKSCPRLSGMTWWICVYGSAIICCWNAQNFKSENLVDIFNLALKFKTNPIPSPTSYLYIYCLTSLRTPHNNGTLIKNFRRNITTSIQLDHSAFNAQ